MSQDNDDPAVTVDEDSLASWEPGGLEYVVRLRGRLDDRWVESFVLTRRRSPRFGRFHLNRGRSRVSFLCRESDQTDGLSAVVENLKLLLTQTNRRALAQSREPETETGEEDRPTQEVHPEIGEATIATHAPRDPRKEYAAPKAPAPPAPPDPPPTPPAPEAGLPEAEDAGSTVRTTEAAPADASGDAPAGEDSTSPAPAARVLEAITAALERLGTAVDRRAARARLAQWMGTASLVVEDGGSEDDLVAAFFAAGDFDAAMTEGELGTISERFGDHVRSLVKACNEAYAVLRPGGDPRLWSLFLRHMLPAARRIVCASRLRSARALLAQYRRLEFARRLSFRDENHAALHDYRSLVEAFLEAGYSSHLVDVLDGVVLEMELAAGPASAERRQKRPLDRLTDELVQRVDLLEE